MINDKNGFFHNWDVSVFSHKAMNTLFQIFISCEDNSYAEQASHEAFNEIDLIEDSLSRFRPNSDISKINNLKANRPLVVSEHTLNCLLKSMEMFDLTKGVFDISMGHIIERWKKGIGSESADERSKMNSLIIDKVNHAVILEKEINIDLGGIGKGYAAEKISELFIDWEIKDYLISCGNSTVKAENKGSRKFKWPLTITNPINNKIFKELSISSISISSSGKVKGEHIIDPLILNPVSNNRVATWVSSVDAALGDALSTAFMIMDSDHITEICANSDSISCLIFLADDEKQIFGNFFGDYFI